MDTGAKKGINVLPTTDSPNPFLKTDFESRSSEEIEMDKANDVLYIADPHGENLEERDPLFLMLKVTIPAEEFKTMTFRALKSRFLESLERAMDKWGMDYGDTGQDLLEELNRRKQNEQGE